MTQREASFNNTIHGITKKQRYELNLLSWEIEKYAVIVNIPEFFKTLDSI